MEPFFSLLCVWQSTTGAMSVGRYVNFHKSIIISYRISHGHWKVEAICAHPIHALLHTLLYSTAAYMLLTGAGLVWTFTRRLFRWEINQYRSHSRFTRDFSQTDSLCARHFFMGDRFNGPAIQQIPFRYNNVSICCVCYFSTMIFLSFFVLSSAIFFVVVVAFVVAAPHYCMEWLRCDASVECGGLRSVGHAGRGTSKRFF